MEYLEQSAGVTSPIGKSWCSHYEKDTQTYYGWDSTLLPNFTLELLNAESKTVAQGSGRGKVKRFVVDGVPLILRHFNRGGRMRYLSKDLYFLPVSLPTRVEAEIKLLLNLYEQALPVPQPAAYRIQRVGIFCRMDIVLKEIVATQNLVEILRAQVIADETWQKIGETIREFHRAGVYHSDLNAHNILLDENNKVWLIDFDKSRIKKAFPKIWQTQNLARLLRSLRKEQARNTEFHWTEDCWQYLLKGY